MGLHLPPHLALFLCIVFILGLFWIDCRRKLPVSRGLWVPVIWMAVTGSRPLSMWFEAPVALEDGSPIDRAVYLALIIAGLIILSRRKEKFSISELIGANAAFSLLLGYYALSILWSDLPFVSFKRYIKMYGMLMMILIILTDADPVLALRTAARRCGFILLSLSIMLAKYFPSIGVSYDVWTGMPMLIGLADSKNGLGQICMVFGLFFLWDFALHWHERAFRRVWLVLAVDAFMFLLAVHLLLMSNSNTSLVCLLLGLATLFATMYDPFRKKIGLYILFGALAFLLLNSIADLIPAVVHSLGRNMTFTDRTYIWQELLPFAEANIWFGVGYEGFWMGDRLPRLAQVVGQVNEAHNGYLEIVLNTGIMGLFLFFLFTVSVFRRCSELLRSKPWYGRFAIAFFLPSLLFNFTEAGFRGIGLVFFFFITIGFRLPETVKERAVYAVSARYQSTTGAWAPSRQDALGKARP